jgi:dimethylhistidine N-methyltransferase
VASQRSPVTFVDLRPPSESFLDDVIAGLSAPRKYLPPKYFYDARGCRLFEAICDLPEYYLTRTELGLMRDHASEMAEALGQDCALIEIGCGNSEKTRLLLKSLRPPVFVPVDIAWEQLEASCDALSREFPGMRIIVVRADFSRPLGLPDEGLREARRKAIYFPGSTIGNFTREEAQGFLARMAGLVGRGGAMLVGIDLKKAPEVLHAAYNDAQGVTADFNLNLLYRINRELGADFDLAKFRHDAFYNAAMGRVEMHLISMSRQTVTVSGRPFQFTEGETIHTENSYKYSVDEFVELARRTGVASRGIWTDPERLFAVHYLAVPE